VNIKKFELFNRVLCNQLDRQVSAYIKKDIEKEEQSKLDSIKTIEILEDMINEDLYKTNETLYHQAKLIFK
jgi:hypothetical protein